MSLLSDYGKERFAQEMASDLQAKGIPLKVKPPRTPEQIEAALKVIKKYNEWRDIHGKSIAKNTRHK